MAKPAFLLLFLVLLCSGFLLAQSKKERQVINAVEALRTAMINSDSSSLDRLTSGKLMYSHSGGKLEDKKAFIQSLLNGKSDFVSINLSDQHITINKKTAVVRHTLSGQTNDSGKPGSVNLIVMSTWQKSWRKWKLLARQAVKVL